MIISNYVVLLLLSLAFLVFCFGVYIKVNDKKVEEKLAERTKKLKKPKRKGSRKVEVSPESVIRGFNESSFVQDIGSHFGNSNTEVLFRKAKNPMGLTVSTYCFIRYFGLAIGLIVSILIFTFSGNFGFAMMFALFGIACFGYPKSVYENAAKKRESQWNQFYQFIWVVKHNLSFYDPRTTWLETEKYIREHSNNLPELEQGFHDFAEHWNGTFVDDYIKETYGDFIIPKQLFDVVLTSQLTGEYPDKELNSLRTVIINKMDFHVQEVLSAIGMKATLYSTPFVMASVTLVTLVPVLLDIVESFA